MTYVARRMLFAVGMLLITMPFRSIAGSFDGTLNIGGGVQVGGTFLDFACSIAYTPTCPAGYGNFSSPSSVIQTGSFVPYGDQFGLIGNLDLTTVPINTNFLFSDFLYFNSSVTLPSPDLALDLTFIPLGVYGQADCFAPPAPGQTCTPAIPALVSAANPAGLSPFNLTNSAIGSSAFFSFMGLVRTISTGETTPFDGTFTAQFTVPYQDLLAELQNGPVPVSFAASVSTEAPEGASSVMVGAGILLCVLGRRNRFSGGTAFLLSRGHGKPPKG
jgi:hypothetical protein